MIKSIIIMSLKSLLRPIKKALAEKYSYYTDQANKKRELVFLNKLIGRDKLVFDIGANIGIKTESFRKLGHKVVALEPQDYCYQVLKQKFSLDDRVIALKKGVGSEKGELELNVSSIYRGFSSFIPDWQKGTKYYTFDKKEKVEITTLDDLISEYGLPFYCKIDVEGFELKVLIGLNKKIPIISFEFHGNDSQLTKNCLEKLSHLGFKKFNFSPFEEYKINFSNWLEKESFFRELAQAISNDPGLWGDIYAQ